MKDQENPHFRRKYADLSAVVEAVREPLARYDLGFLQKVQVERDQKDYNVSVTTVIIHASGQSIESTVTLPVADPRPQAIGSAITYARRYGLAAMLGVSTKEEEDDDAESAEGRGRAASQTRVATPPASPPRGQMKKADEIAHAARVKDIWKRAKALGYDTDAKFDSYVSTVLGKSIPWDEWTKADVDALEKQLEKNEAEDIKF